MQLMNLTKEDYADGIIFNNNAAPAANYRHTYATPANTNPLIQTHISSPTNTISSSIVERPLRPLTTCFSPWHGFVCFCILHILFFYSLSVSWGADRINLFPASSEIICNGAALVTQSSPVNFAEEQRCLPCSLTFDLHVLTRISNCLQADESCLVFLKSILNQISQSNVNFKQHFIKKEKTMSNKDSMSFGLI